ncbi:MAG: hypothetical protein JEZ06_06280 [Anaerolineaceae bacterium]|nr:hypothetical protein [Anaerolineaceae bacterium]
MPKTFYTEHDIEDMFKAGTTSINVCDDVVLTDMAYERAKSLGVSLVQQNTEKPPAAPERPYLNKDNKTSTARTQPLAKSSAGKLDSPELRQRIKDAVSARLGSQVDPGLLDRIITRVLSTWGMS